MKPFIRPLVRLLFVFCILFVARAALAQAAPTTSSLSLAAIIAWLTANTPKFVAIGTALSAFCAVVVAQFPSLTWVSKLATILGYLPVIDIHGLTTGTMQLRMKAAVEAAKLPTKAAPSAAA